MKRTMKKIAACLLALLMMIQMIPALAATYSSGMIVGSSSGYKELLAIVASKGTYVLVGQTLRIDANEDYQPDWSSSNTTVATIDGDGVVTAIAAGSATITATVSDPQYQTASIEVMVIDPEPIIAEAAEEPVEEPVEEPAKEQTEEQTEQPAEEKTEDQPEEPAEGQTEEQTEKPEEAQTGEQTEQPAEGQTEEQTEKPVEGQTEVQTEQPAEGQTEEPVEGTTEEPIEEPDEEPVENPEEEPTEVEENQGTEVENTEEQTSVHKEPKPLVIVINGENEHVTYDGEEHLLNRFVATANEDFFDETKLHYEGELGVTGKDCGIYEFALDSIKFTYDDPDVLAYFVLNNSFLKITPAQVTVTANDASKNEHSEDPELTATVLGLLGEDTIEYTMTRAEGEEVGEYEILPVGEEIQGNYRIEYIPAKLYITGEPIVTIESSVPEGDPVYKGTVITLKAVAAGFGDVELAYQWQYSTDNENWIDIDGATAAEYTYTVSRQNAKYIYRVSVNPVN